MGLSTIQCLMEGRDSDNGRADCEQTSQGRTLSKTLLLLATQPQPHRLHVTFITAEESEAQR